MSEGLVVLADACLVHVPVDTGERLLTPTTLTTTSLRAPFWASRTDDAACRWFHVERVE
jgi:hypothetical protein